MRRTLEFAAFWALLIGSFSLLAAEGSDGTLRIKPQSAQTTAPATQPEPALSGSQQTGQPADSPKPAVKKAGEASPSSGAGSEGRFVIRNVPGRTKP